MKRWDQGEGFDDPEDAEVYKDCFKATSMKSFSLNNEIRVWLKIEALVGHSLKQYDCTYSQDLEILA